METYQKIIIESLQFILIVGDEFTQLAHVFFLGSGKHVIG